MRQVVLDTETTGLEPEQGHRVIEIGCVELVNRRKTGRKFHRYLRPDRLIDRAAQHVHGITDEFLAQQPRFAEVVDELIEFISGALQKAMMLRRCDWPIAVPIFPVDAPTMPVGFR